MSVSSEHFLAKGAFISTSRNELLVGWGERTWRHSSEGCDSPIFYFPDFFLKNQSPWFTHEYWEKMSVDTLLEILSIPNKKKFDLILWFNPHKFFFVEVFDEILEKIQNHQFQKIVPYIFEQTSQIMDPSLLQQSIQSLFCNVKDQPLHSYGFWDESEGMIGATPETLFDIDLQTSILQTMACAATCSHISSPKELFQDLKQLKEHSLVVDGIEESLNSFGAMEKGKLELLELPTLSHLVTPINVQLNKEFDFESIVKAIHPTPALGAYPKAAGTSWLESYQQKINRNRFGAPVGYMFENSAKCYVAIRNVQWDNSGMYIGAGCGIVRDSILEKEWKEICLKIQSIKTLLSF